MKKNYLLSVLFAFAIISVNAQFEDDMESYSDGDPIIGAHWTDWGCGGGPGCAIMSSSVQVHGGSLSGLVPDDADAEGKPGFIITKVEHVIRDCDGNEVFRSIKGKSDIKDYKKAYYEAAREAFKSVRDLYVNQKEISVYEDVTAVKKVNSNATKPNKEMVTSVVIANEVKNEKPKEVNSSTSETVSKENLPSAKFSNYSNLDKTFLLRKTKEGYSFYEESSASEDGLLLIGKIIGLDTGVLFIDSNKNKLTAHFDAAQNLIIEKEEGEVVYKLER